MTPNLTNRLFAKNHAVLTKDEIDHQLRKRRLSIEPLLHEIDSCSVDVRLDNYFGIFTSTGEAALDPGKKSRAIEFEEVPFFTRPFYAQPGTFILAQTLEFVALPKNILANIDGRSSLGRRGLLVHATAGWIDPGWEGHITLELSNLGIMPLALYPGMRIGRVVFQEVAAVKEYQGQFQMQLRIKEPKVDSDCAAIAAYAETIRKRRFSRSSETAISPVPGESRPQ